MYRNISALIILGVVGGLACGEITLSVNDNDFFVFTGEGEEVLGLELTSASGALIPIPGPSPSAAPFNILLINTQTDIVWGNLGDAYTLDGTFTTSAGFNRAIGAADLEANWGGHSPPVARPITISPDLLVPCEDCPLPPLQITLDDENKFRVTGAGHELEELSFRSESGSLAVATSSAPFASTTVNSPNEIKYSSGGTAVTLDGEVTLDAGWNNHLYRRDVEYDYREAGGETSPTARIPSQAYDLPKFPKLDVTINDQHNFVLHGNNQPISELTIESRALIPGASAAPFASQTVSEAGIRLSPAGSHLTIDGSVELSSKWDVDKGTRDVVVRADLLGDVVDQVVRLSGSDYPPVPEKPDIVVLSLNQNNSFVVSANGVELIGVRFVSEGGSLRPVPTTGNADDASPFQFLLSNTPNEVTYGNLGTGVMIDGSVTLGSGWDESVGIRDVVFDWANSREPVVVPLTAGFYDGAATGGSLPGVSVSGERGLVLSNFEASVESFTFSSSSGTLSALDIPDAWTLVSNTGSEITFTSETGISPQDLAALELSWASSFDNNVFVSFTLMSGESFGPFSLSVVPEPGSALLLLSACLGLLRFRRRRERFTA